MNQPEELNQSEESLQELEENLTKALRHVAPADGFIDRVLARAQSPVPVRAKVLWMTSRPRLWASGAIAATLIAGVLIAEQTHIRHQRQATELAQHQFDVALAITGQALVDTRQQLKEADVEIDK